MCIRDSPPPAPPVDRACTRSYGHHHRCSQSPPCLLYTSDAADDLTRVDLGVRRIFQAEDGIRDLVRSRGLGDVYKRQSTTSATCGSSLYALVRAPPPL